MKKKLDILNGNLTGIILKLSAPIFMANLLQTLYSLTDAYFIGKIGGLQVAAFFYVLPVISTILAFGQGLSVAGTALISRAIGSGIRRDIEENIEQFFIFSLYLSFFLGGIGYFFRDGILKFLGTEGELLLESSKYLKIIFLDTPFSFITLTYTAIRKSEGHSEKALTILLISVFINIILTPIFIFHMQMGIEGAALGTFLSKLVAATYCIYELKNSKIAIRYKIKIKRLDKKLVMKFVKLAIPSAISNASQSLGNVILNSYVRDYGTAVLAAYGVGNKLNSLFFMPSSSTSASLAVTVGQNYGAKKYERILEGVKSCMKITFVISMLGILVLQIFPRELASIFVKDEEVIVHTISFIKVVSWTVLTWGIFQTFSGFFNGVGQTQKTMFISIFRLWGIRIPVLLLLYKFFNMGEYTIWYAMFYSNLITAVFGGALFFNSSIYKEISFKIKGDNIEFRD